ncbi:short-chain dehydrogenase [Hypomontagnella submonticulosa]|nr:short-chain dehydrogenase [Hypomontagnella submonticulosa]
MSNKANKPTYTEEDVPDLSGKVHLVTGANTGLSKEFAQILFSGNATVWLELLHLDLCDLTAIKKSVETFLANESRLLVLFINAGVMMPPRGSKSAQGYELFTPALAETAKVSPKSSVRVVWVSSASAESMVPVKDSVDMDNLDYKDIFYPFKQGVTVLFVHPVVLGAYTELFAGLSDEVALERTGSWIVPWGRFGEIRKDLLQGSVPQSEGGTGLAQKFRSGQKCK